MNCEDVVIDIIDNGCGIPKELHKKILKPHFMQKVSEK